MILFRNLKKEVEIGANGTQKYIIKKGINKRAPGTKAKGTPIPRTLSKS